jgi:8-oxo-dGTP diphosphatase
VGRPLVILSARGRGVPSVELAAAVVVLDDHVLVVRRSEEETFLPSQWGVPCGKLDKGESPETGVLRELAEETGLSGEVLKKVGKSEFRSVWHGRRVINIQFNYLVRPHVNPESADSDGMPKIKLPRDDQKSMWVPTADLGRVDLDRHNLRTIRQGLESRHSALASHPVR